MGISAARIESVHAQHMYTSCSASHTCLLQHDRALGQVGHQVDISHNDLPIVRMHEHIHLHQGTELQLLLQRPSLAGQLR